MRGSSRLLQSACFFLIGLMISPSLAAAAARVITSFDPDWQFLQKDAGSGQDVSLDDSTWRTLDVPHDWSIEGPIAQANRSGGAGGFFPDGIAWYRKHFTLPDEDAQKRVFIDFDGVMADSDVWINGFHLGNRPYGYVSFEYELTGHLNFGPGSSNVLAVKSDTTLQPASRYYLGAGIVRHVRLVATDPVHLDYQSVFVSTPQITPTAAVVHVAGTIVNQGDASHQIAVHVALIGPDGASVPFTTDPVTPIAVDAGKSVDFFQDLQIDNPKLWDLDQPQLYKAVVSLAESDKTLDDTTATFGIRAFKFDPATGFILNGKNIRIQGVCLHADGSAFGLAVPIGAWERRLTALKQWGVNGIRTAHNPPDPAFLDLCDRMGFVVMDEMYDCWDVAKARQDYHLYFDKWSLIDLRDTVRRDRNHPSIFLYSSGNEIHDTPNGPKSVAILTGLIKEFHANDPTRPVTQALLRPNASHDYDDGLAALLDVVGTNYRMSELLAAQQNHPTWALVGTENHLSDVPILAKNPPLSGIYIWAGVDYLGESLRWPQISSGSGLLDRVDMPKTDMYQTATVWSSKSFVHMVRGAGGRGRAAPATPIDGDMPGGNGPPIAPPAARGGGFAGRGRGPTPDWSPANQAAHQETIAVYSNCSSVELFLNGTSLGKSDRPGNNGTFNFNVGFVPGSLKATGYDASGQAVATEEFQTAGPAAKIVLTPDVSKVADDYDGVSFVQTTVTDANGIPVPTANNEITFTVSGAGKLAAVDSADPTNHEPFQGGKRQAYSGICFAIVKANAPSGDITITATAPGLADGNATVQAVAGNP